MREEEWGGLKVRILGGEDLCREVVGRRRPLPVLPFGRVADQPLLDDPQGVRGDVHVGCPAGTGEESRATVAHEILTINGTRLAYAGLEGCSPTVARRTRRLLAARCSK